MKLIRQLSAFVLLAAVAAAQEKPDPDRGLRVFSAGHSFHPHLPSMLDEVAKSAGFTGHIIAGSSLAGGAKTETHWLIPDPSPIKEALMASSVDVLTLAPIHLPDDGIAKFTQFGSEHNRSLRVTIAESWLPFDEYQPAYHNEPRILRPVTVDHNAATGDYLRRIHTPYFAEMDRTVAELNANLEREVAYVVPVGQAVIALREKIITGQAPGLKEQRDLFSDPEGNPEPALQILATYCHYAVIYRRNPSGLPVPAALVGFPAEEAAALNSLLQQIAWEAVTAHPLSGVK